MVSVLVDEGTFCVAANMDARTGDRD